MDNKKIYQIIKVAKMYYEANMSQEEIAKEQGISKATVSRLLQKGIDNGYIQVKINYQMASVTELESKLKSYFGLKDVFVSPVMVDVEEIILNDVCQALSDNLDNYIRDQDVVGVSWGNTMNALADTIQSLSAKNVEIVQLNGGVPKKSITTAAEKIVEKLSMACNGEGYSFPVPAIVDNKIIADVLKNDSQVSHILELAQKSNTTIFSIGAVSKDSILYQSGYFTKEEYDHLIQLNAVGDICSRYYDINGKIVDQDIDNRVVGITLNEIREKENRIAIVTGQKKVDAIIGALRGNYPNILFTDEKTAQRLIEKYEGTDSNSKN